MKLKTLIHDLPIQVKGKKEVEIQGITAHSRQVGPGDLFIAKKGLKQDGSLFIEEAVSSGAVCVLTDLYNPFLPSITQLITPDPSLIEAEIAKRFYKDPSKDLYLMGITGTNGKTTTTYLIRHLFENTPKACGLIGTIETLIGDYRFPSNLTTPDVITLNRVLSEMRKKGCVAAAAEISSHALIQKRIEGLEFDSALFTNISQDHLDYHKTLHEYARAKSLLFSQLGSNQHKKNVFGIINKDDEYAPMMMAACQAPLFLYSLNSEQADLIATQISYKKEGTRCVFTYKGQEQKAFIPLLGRYNVYNALAAVSAHLVRGSSLKDLAERLESFQGVAGRLQKVKNRKKISVYVDFAHTEEALRHALSALRPLTKGKLIAVFGCGGDRDQAKRPKMAAAAAHVADELILTSDNPRSEDPHAIIEQMVQGLKNKQYLIEIDRKQAIHKALDLAKKGDVVLIAGKGHESSQTFKEKIFPFNDVAVIQEY